MPIADLPYRIGRLARDGQYAYLTKNEKGKIRVLRSVTLCDGPELWNIASCKDHAFYVTLRLFTTASILKEYLEGPELASYVSAAGVPFPKLEEADLIVTRENFLTESVSSLARTEYMLMLKKHENGGIENLEEIVRRVHGLDDMSAVLGEPIKRTRRKKILATDEQQQSINPPVVVTSSPKGDSSDNEDEAASASHPLTTVASAATTTRKKKRSHVTLREQFALVQNTPSRVIDVSGFGDTMQHQKGRMLDRVKHATRLSQCTCLGDLFPIVSDNIPAFERAMAVLGPRYASKVVEFKSRHSAELR